MTEGAGYQLGCRLAPVVDYGEMIAGRGLDAFD
jgi:hypothetical protein